jgi:hypothetical protein
MEILSMLILILALILGVVVSVFVFMVWILPSAARERYGRKGGALGQRSLSIQSAARRWNLQAHHERERKVRPVPWHDQDNGELTINAALISEHLAVPYSGQNKKEIEAAHKANYKVLKEKGLLC